MHQPAPPPPAALAGMDDWDVTVAWSLAPGRATWRLQAPHGEIRFLKVGRCGNEPPLAAERDRLGWAATRLPVPTVLGFGTDGQHEWLLTAALPGTAASDQPGDADPEHLVRALAQGLRLFHAVPAADCPFGVRADTLLRTAEARVAAGQVDPQLDFHAEHRSLTATAALARLRSLRPDREDLVVCHGDYCLPNALVSSGRVSGYVDLGGLGVADRWWDLAVATWSVTWNLGPGWEDLFLAEYGVPRDSARIAFYRLLHDLLP